ncbi:MAG: hypothetical protein WAK22_16170 [Candidatus Sulfotelmatobacter sp.]
MIYVANFEKHIVAECRHIRCSGKNRLSPKTLDVLARKLYDTLQAAAKVLDIEDAPAQQEFSGTLREMPAFGPGQLTVRLVRLFL